MRLDSRLATAILGVAIAVFPLEIAVSLTPQDVSNIAKRVTVLISGAKLGSGVIIHEQNNTYTVLTNWHVVEDLGTYTVQTQDQSSHQVTPNLITRLPGVDLAILKFTSRQKYTVATLGNSDAAIEGTTVYVSGAPTPVQGIENRTVLVPDGRIVGTYAKPQDGYALIYNNITFPGMSGGPVLDENGRLVAIHGRGARDKEGQKVGFNLGIPINIFTNSQVANSLNLGVVTTTPLPPSKPPSPSTPITGRPPTINGSGTTGSSVCPGRRC
ncbi:S1 family peptidase [Anabaena sp. CCY 9402-a]|uniref:S1 family peptidase n=1 Tax=Anabaena sp. CCY 9402-a TaxID=3103867 RepID=UPI0039C6B409